MPTKQIYIKDEDIGVFEKAKEISGDSYSTIVTEALKLYINLKSGESVENKEVIEIKMNGKHYKYLVDRVLE